MATPDVPASRPPPVLIYAPPPGEPDILYRDEALLAIDKPAGLLSVPGRGPALADCLASRVKVHFPEARIVHRLDMATSGLIVLALGAEMERRLSIAFQQRTVEKRYIAVVTGHPAAESGEIMLPLIADWPNRPRQIVDQERGKPSLTGYTVLEYDPASDTSRVELRPHTGRTHQLRVHMQAIGHPILGDELYSADGMHKLTPRLMLHATSLSLTHPLTGQQLKLESPPPF